MSTLDIYYKGTLIGNILKNKNPNRKSSPQFRLLIDQMKRGVSNMKLLRKELKIIEHVKNDHGVLLSNAKYKVTFSKFMKFIKS